MLGTCSGQVTRPPSKPSVQLGAGQAIQVSGAEPAVGEQPPTLTIRPNRSEIGRLGSIVPVGSGEGLAR